MRARRAALRDLRLGPARPPPLRRAGRRAGARPATTRSCAPTSRSCSATSSAARSPSYGPTAPRSSATGHAGRRAPAGPARHGRHPIGLSPPAPGAYAEQVAGRGVADVAPCPTGSRPSSPRSPSRWRSGCTPSGAAEIAQGRRGDRDRLRAGRARRDLHAQGPRRAHGRRQRLLAGPPRARRGVRRRHRRRPDASDSPYDGAGPKRPPRRPSRRRSSSRSARWRSCGGCRCRGSTSGALAERSAPSPKRPVIFECVGVPGMIDEHHRQRAAVLARGRGRRLHGRRQHPAVDGDQQGDRPALRRRLHAAGVPRHPAHARRGQGGRRAARDRDRRAGRRRPTRSTRSATPRRTPRS